MGIHPATFPDLDDPYAQTCQVKSGNGDNEQKTLQGFWRCQFTGVDLVAA